MRRSNLLYLYRLQLHNGWRDRPTGNVAEWNLETLEKWTGIQLIANRCSLPDIFCVNVLMISSCSTVRSVFLSRMFIASGTRPGFFHKGQMWIQIRNPGFMLDIAFGSLIFLCSWFGYYGFSCSTYKESIKYTLSGKSSISEWKLFTDGLY